MFTPSDRMSDSSSTDNELHGLLSSSEKISYEYVRTGSLWKSTFTYGVQIVLTALLTSGIVCMVLFSHRPQVSTVLHAPCGSTAIEARAAGCHFDIISFAWLPDACYDSELSEEFDRLREWEWFLDINQTEKVSKAEALTGQHQVLYVNWDYHITHCTYMWKKMHRAIMGNGRSAIDMYIGPVEHTSHCSHMLLSNREMALDTVNTGIRVKYPDCGLDVLKAWEFTDNAY